MLFMARKVIISFAFVVESLHCTLTCLGSFSWWDRTFDFFVHSTCRICIQDLRLWGIRMPTCAFRTGGTAFCRPGEYEHRYSYSSFNPDEVIDRRR